ncbi:hypothetical protein [Roseomonas sp. WA12]
MYSVRSGTPRSAGRGGEARRPDAPLRAPSGNLCFARADKLPAAHHALTGDTPRALQGATLRPTWGDETRAQGGARTNESPR